MVASAAATAVGNSMASGAAAAATKTVATSSAAAPATVMAGTSAAAANASNQDLMDKDNGEPGSFVVKVKIKACTNVTFSN